MQKNKKLSKNRTRFIVTLLGGILAISPVRLCAGEELEEKVGHAVQIDMGRAASQHEIISAEMLLSQNSNKQLKEYGTPDLIAVELAALAQEQNSAYQELVTYYKEKSYPAVRVTQVGVHGPFEDWDKEKDAAYGQLQTRVMPLLASRIVKKKAQLVGQNQRELEAEGKKRTEFWCRLALPMAILSGLETIVFIAAMIHRGSQCG